MKKTEGMDFSYYLQNKESKRIMKGKIIGSLLILALFIPNENIAQRRKASNEVRPFDSELFKNFKFRNIGPAFMSGRIADIAIDPTNENVWYVAVGSGGVWKTVNAGTTFEPTFDGQSVYSIGCVSIDPSNPYTIWVGTGENVGGRHIGFGDGIYRSNDGGESWQNMGLEQSEHISKIMVHPDDSDVIYVASQGPLWSPGGQRGFFKSMDGGFTWTKTLGGDEFTGVTDFVVDPRDPNRIYAASWQHHRTVAALMDGGPLTKIFLSVDGGENWKVLDQGLPETNMGKIGLAISPIDPDVVYAAIELDRRKGGIWRSSNRGGSWEKMSDMVSGGTGPHYYQELYASPHEFDRLYLMNNYMKISEDGGKTWRDASKDSKHVDNHIITFKHSDPNYLLVGTDGGIYESFDLGENWRYMTNLPLTQYYKVAVDDATPFYNIYGGTQDNNTQGGPSRTDNVHGIRNADWSVVLGGDGHQPATEPGNPNIIYAQSQQGYLNRIDMKTGETLMIRPVAGEGEAYERYNWDAPILVSPHSPTTLFFASQRVWKSENRGDSWVAISEDLTKNENRFELPIMGKQQSFDMPWDVYAMSNYNTITSLAQSPVNPDLIYAGTDDGILQVTSNGGESWTKIEVSKMGVPSLSFINDVKADMYDENTVYVSLDNHKYGDYLPYLVVSTDKGATWKKITNGLGSKNLVWRLVQDHKEKNLLFLATEFGIYFSVNKGSSWTKLEGGTPTISFRDLAIQKREDDLVAASFGRGFFVLDDYSALRNISGSMDVEAALFKPRDAWWYIPRRVLGSTKRSSKGDQYYVADNPDFGAVFTYFLKDSYLSKEESRKADEEGLDGDITFPGWDQLDQEQREESPKVYLEISKNGKVINRVDADNEKGLNRVSWNLKVPSKYPLELDKKVKEGQGGYMVAPGTYTATLYKSVDGVTSKVSEPVDFNVKKMTEGSLKGVSADELETFYETSESLYAEVGMLSVDLKNTGKKLEKLKIGAERSRVSGDVLNEIAMLRSEFDKLDLTLNGNKAKNEVGEKNDPSISSRMGIVLWGSRRSFYGPTQMQKDALRIVSKELAQIKADMKDINEKASAIYKQVVDAGGPVIEGF